jgi:hypothetical protein
MRFRVTDLANQIDGVYEAPDADDAIRQAFEDWCVGSDGPEPDPGSVTAEETEDALTQEDHVK